MTLRKWVAACAVLVTALVTSGSPASAAAWADDHFKICVDAKCLTYTSGVIKWGNRQAQISGVVQDAFANSHATVYFDVFAGSTFVDHTTRTASAFDKTTFGFPFGDPDLVGGVNRVKVQLCWVENPGWCSEPKEFVRN